MTDLTAENARLRAQLGDLDRVLRAVEGLGTYSAEVLSGLVSSFEGDPAHERVALAIHDLAERFAEVCGSMAEALRSTNH